MKLTRLLSSLALGLSVHAASAQQPSSDVDLIDLNELVQLALQRDFDIRVSGLSADIAEQNARAAGGFWDPAVRAQVSDGAIGTSGSARNSFFNDESEGQILEAGIDANLPTGARLTLDAAGGKFEGDDDLYAANAGIGISQPLLRDFGAATARSRIRIAKRNHQQSQYLFEQQVISTITEAITLYNQVALAKDSLLVAEQSRELAKRLVADTARRASLGAVESRGVEVAETRLAQRETIVVLQRRLYFDALNELKRLVTSESLGLVKWQVEVGEMPMPVDWEGDLDSDFEYALQNRPDYKHSLLEIEKAELQARASGSLSLPQLDLVARYSYTSYGDSYSNSFDALEDAQDDLFVGIVFNRPILNREARANHAADRIRVDQVELIKQQLQQSVAIQLDNGARRIEAEAQSRALTRQGREFAARGLEAEERKLKLGQSTTFLVLELQEDLAEAQIRELDAIANYNIAIARYQQIKGTTLQANAVEL